jgi:hypothetical protein
VKPVLSSLPSKPNKDTTKKKKRRKIIHDDQAGFSPEMQGQFNTCKSVNIIKHRNKIKDKKSYYLIRYRKSI